MIGFPKGCRQGFNSAAFLSCTQQEPGKLRGHRRPGAESKMSQSYLPLTAAPEIRGGLRGHGGGPEALPQSETLTYLPFASCKLNRFTSSL